MSILDPKPVTEARHDQATADAINGTGPTRTALNATFAGKGTESTASSALSLATSGKPSPVAAVSRMISNLQAGHGWTNINGTANLNDTTDYVLGTQAAKITTAGTGVSTSFDKTSLTVNATGKSIVLWLKVDNLANLNTAILYLGDSTLDNNWNGQVLNGPAFRETQHHIRSGEWAKIVIPFNDLTTTTGIPDRANITRARLTFTDRNAGAPVTMHLNGLGLVDESTQYPSGVISLTFDDNPESQYTVARPKMDQYGYSGTLYPIIDRIGAAGQMTLAQMKTLQDANGWDFGAHASTLDRHIAGFQDMTEAELVTEFETIRAWMRDNGLRGESFAWPNGDSSTLAETMCARYFRSARSTYTRTHEVLPPNMPFRLRSINPTSLTLAQMQAEVDRAKSGKYWLVFVFHAIVGTKASQNDVATADYNALIDYINAQAVPVRTVSQVLASLS